MMYSLSSNDGLKLFGSICHIFHVVSQFVMLIIKMVAKIIKVFITFLCIKSQSLKIKTSTRPHANYE